MEKNNSVKCDVCKCKHNVDGSNCKLKSVHVTSDCDSCTCCQDFEQKR